MKKTFMAAIAVALSTFVSTPLQARYIDQNCGLTCQEDHGVTQRVYHRVVHRRVVHRHVHRAVARKVEAPAKIVDANANTGTPITSCVARGDCAWKRHALAQPMGDEVQKAIPVAEEIPVAKRTGSQLVSIKCGPRHIKVAASASQQFEGFCAEFYAAYKFRVVGGFRPDGCGQAHKHGCGGAIDISQSCRSRGPGHCLPKDFPVALSEQLAAKYWLWPGSKWGYRDVGHFEIRNGLASNGWRPKATMQLASLPPEPAPKHWPIPAEKPTRTASPTDLALYAYNEYLPMKPASIALASLDVPAGNAKQEALRAADAFGLDRDYMLAVARVESDFNCGNKTGQYKGTFQLSNYEYNSHLGGGSVFDCRRNAFAAASKFVTERVEFEHAVGREATFEDMYLVHQQGLGGAIAHLTHPEQVAWRSMCMTDEGKEKGAGWCKKAIWGNTLPYLKDRAGSVEKLTSAAFVEHWNERVRKLVAHNDEPVRQRATVVASADRHKRRHIAHRVVRTRVASYQVHESYDAYTNLPR